MRVPLDFLFSDVLASFVLKEAPFVLLLWSAFNIMCFLNKEKKGKKKEMTLKKIFIHSCFFLPFICVLLKYRCDCKDNEYTHTKNVSLTSSTL